MGDIVGALLSLEGWGSALPYMSPLPPASAVAFPFSWSSAVPCPGPATLEQIACGPKSRESSTLPRDIKN